MTAWNKRFVILRACLVFWVAVSLAEISADDVINLQHGELGVDEREFGEIAVKGSKTCIAVHIFIFYQFRQYPAACDTRTLTALFVCLAGCVKTYGSGPAQLTQYRHACRHVDVGNTHLADCSCLRYVHYKTLYVHEVAPLHP